MLFKRTLFCGIVWCIGSLQYLAKGAPAVFVLTLLLGAVECLLSVRYGEKYKVPMAVMLSIQSLYYAACFFGALLVPGLLSKLLGAALAAGMLAVTVSALYSLSKRS